MQEMKEKQNSCLQRVEEVRKLERTRDECVARLETVQRTKEQLESGLHDNYAHPTEELVRMLSTFERDLQERRKKDHELTVRLHDVSESHDKAESNMQVKHADRICSQNMQIEHAGNTGR